MLVRVPDHFSSCLRFKINNNSGSVIDRTSPTWAILGMIGGFLLLVLGVSELFSFLTQDISKGQSFLSVEIFAFLIVILALALIFTSLFSYIRYKKILFDGKKFTIIYRPAIGIKHCLTEPLSNYMGVRLRVLFVQSGLTNKNRYIIDLFNQDQNKTIPLYISTKNTDIRKIWTEYARLFKLPALSVSDRGLVLRECSDLNKSVRELAKEKKLPFIAHGELPAPQGFNIMETSFNTLISPKEIYWDTFSTLFLLTSLSLVLVLIAGSCYLSFVGTAIPSKYWLIFGLLVLSVFYFIIKLFAKPCLIIDNEKISIKDNLLGLSCNQKFIFNDCIENIELSYNPVIDRYSLAIISDDNIVHFGGRLPAYELIWLKDFILRKLIG